MEQTAPLQTTVVAITGLWRNIYESLPYPYVVPAYARGRSQENVVFNSEGSCALSTNTLVGLCRLSSP